MDIMKYLCSSKHTVCLESLDFVGLSSRLHHMKGLFWEYSTASEVEMKDNRTIAQGLAEFYFRLHMENLLKVDTL
jgi:hypothetical protein